MASALRQKRREEEEITRVRAEKTKTRLAEIVPYKPLEQRVEQRKFASVEADATKVFDVHTVTPVKTFELADSEKGWRGLRGQGTVGAFELASSIIRQGQELAKRGSGGWPKG